MPAALADGAPRVEVADDGTEAWLFDGRRHPQIGLNAVVGRPKRRVVDGAGQLRRHAPRLLGPRGPTGRHGRRRGVGLAALPVAHRRVRRVELLPLLGPRRWGWPACGRGTTGTSTSGSVPAPTGSSRSSCRGCPTPRWPRPRSGATPSAASGRSASSSSRSTWVCRRCTPTTGIRSCAACEETGTVVCLHCASSGWSASRSPYAPLELLTTLFPVNALVTCADWLWSGVPVRFPEPADLPGRVGHRLGADADQPHRLRDGPLGHRASGGVGLTPSGPPHRGAAPGLLVRRHRPHVVAGAAPPDRRRPHRAGERLPPRRLDLARHLDAGRHSPWPTCPPTRPTPSAGATRRRCSTSPCRPRPVPTELDRQPPRSSPGRVAAGSSVGTGNPSTRRSWGNTKHQLRATASVARPPSTTEPVVPSS